MKRILFTIFAIVSLFSMTSCTENFSNGERIGFISRFSDKGLIWKSWEADLNVTQTGMNTVDKFHFSVDNDKDDKDTKYLIARLDSAANFGWKVKIVYHEVKGFNIAGNRGDSDYFINDLIILDRNANTPNTFKNSNNGEGRVVDTIYVVIMDSKLKK